MKIRTGFVSNSSSASFVVKKRFLTDQQIDLIKNHAWSGRKWADTDAWDIEDKGTHIEGYTDVDNFNMRRFMQDIGVTEARFYDSDTTDDEWNCPYSIGDRIGPPWPKCDEQAIDWKKEGF